MTKPATIQEWKAGREQVRYVVSFVPTDDVVRRCEALGMREGDGSSFWDWMEPEDCEQTRAKRTFAEAIEHARAVLPRDVFDEVRIAREQLVQEQDDLGNTFKCKVWREDAVWHLIDAAEHLSEDTPDYHDA